MEESLGATSKEMGVWISMQWALSPLCLFPMGGRGEGESWKLKDGYSQYIGAY